jgi:hypothetical protein
MDVAILFWGLYAKDRQTVFPDEIDSFFPSWLNHIIHTNIAVFILIEMVILYREYPSRKECLTGLGIFVLGYLVWLNITRYFAGRWTYPILDHLPVPGKIAFMAFISCFPFLMYFLGEFLNGKIWTSTRIERKTNEADNRNP